MLTRAITVLPGVAETLLRETATRLRALWGFGRRDEARLENAWCRDAGEGGKDIGGAGNQADSGTSQTALPPPHVWRRRGFASMQARRLVFAEVN